MLLWKFPTKNNIDFLDSCENPLISVDFSSSDVENYELIHIATDEDSKEIKVSTNEKLEFYLPQVSILVAFVVILVLAVRRR